jgi:hypothetical protein
MSERIRYSRIDTGTCNRVPKNTLLTIRNGDLVHFGIARCNTKFDRFKKDIGKLIAKNRARVAASEAGVGGIPGKQLKASDVDGLILHHSGLRGTIKIDNIKILLKYFKDIDKSMLPEHMKDKIIDLEAI